MKLCKLIPFVFMFLVLVPNLSHANTVEIFNITHTEAIEGQQVFVKFEIFSNLSIPDDEFKVSMIMVFNGSGYANYPIKLNEVEYIDGYHSYWLVELNDIYGRSPDYKAGDTVRCYIRAMDEDRSLNCSQDFYVTYRAYEIPVVKETSNRLYLLFLLFLIPIWATVLSRRDN